MAKRFTDTNKWGKRWFRLLPPRIKCLWSYLLDSCDAAGVWDVDIEKASFDIGEPFGDDVLDVYFSDKVKWIEDDKIFIIDFIDFQYGELSEKCNPHKAIIKLVKKHKLDLRVPERVPDRVTTRFEEKEQDKEQDKEQEQEKESVIEINEAHLVNLWNKNFPNHNFKSFSFGRGKNWNNFQVSIGYLPKYENWQELFNICKESDFLLNKHKGFSLVWAINYDNILEIREGKYQNRDTQTDSKPPIGIILQALGLGTAKEMKQLLGTNFDFLEKMGGYEHLRRLTTYEIETIYRGVK